MDGELVKLISSLTQLGITGALLVYLVVNGVKIYKLMSNHLGELKIDVKRLADDMEKLLKIVEEDVGKSD